MEQKEAEQEVRHYVESQLPSAIFVLKDLIGKEEALGNEKRPNRV